jgi:hypothetical protein
VTTRVAPRVWVPYVLVVVALVLVAYLGGAPRGEGAPLDPRSSAPDGTKALVDTLRELDVDVLVSPATPTPATTTAILFRDALDETQVAPIRTWVENGGTLVVTDIDSRFAVTTPSRDFAGGFVEPELDRECDEPALAGVDRVLVPNAVLLRVPQGGFGCFTAGSRDAYLVSAPLGRGRVVQLGGGGAFINSRLDRADNGLLAVTLLAPERASRVAVLQPAIVRAAGKSLTELVSPRVKLALLQLLIAFAIVVLWRARRLGRPVLEPQPVQIAGSELVTAVGNLLQRARGRPQAAMLLREDLRRTLADWLGLPAGAPAEGIAAAVAARTTVPSDRVIAALVGPEPASEEELVAFAQTIESIRQEVSRAR